jgi:hypothetical protein
MIQEGREDFASIIFHYFSKSSGLYIGKFTTAVNHPKYRLVATEQEINISKGLGKYILCMLLTILLSKQLVREDTKVALRAMPFLSCNFDIDSKIKLHYEQYTNEDAIRKIKKFPNLYEMVMEKISKYVDSKKIRRRLVLSLCKLEHLISLVSYYKKLGFRSSKATENYTSSLKMHSDVHSILMNC